MPCVPANFAPSATTLPTVAGTAAQGSTLTATDSTWVQNGGGFAVVYQWQRSLDGGTTPSDIPAANALTYLLAAGDVGAVIRIVSTATNTLGGSTSVPSAWTAVVTAAAPPGSATSVTQNGVTFTFDKAYPVGQFVNGDWWALPNPGDAGVTVASITPASTGTGSTARNGWMANPVNQGSCYDGRTPLFSAAFQKALPYLAPVNTSIVKAVSLASVVGVGANQTYLSNAVVLTILAAAPATDAFRPPYFGTAKRIFTQSQLQTGLLPSLASPGGGPPSLANVEGRYQQVQLDHCYSTSPAGPPRPLASFHSFGSTSTPHVYGENLARDNAEAILRTFLNDSLAAKQNSVNYLVQAGIDWYGIAKSGTTVASNGGGGHMGGRKIVVAYAGWLLADSDVQAVAGETTGAGFGEPQQFYFSAAAGGAGSHFTGQGAGMALFGWTNPFGKPFPYAGSGAKDIRDTQAFVDGGLTTQSPLGVHPSTTSATYHGGLYADIAPAHALSCGTILGIVPALRTIFNWDPELFYGDRLWSFGFWTVPDGGPARDLGSFVAALHGTEPGGASIAAPYPSPFANAMRAAYYLVNTFTG